MLHTHKEGVPSLASFTHSLVCSQNGILPKKDFSSYSLSNIMAGSMKASLVLLLISLDPRPFLSPFLQKGERKDGEGRKGLYNAVQCPLLASANLDIPAYYVDGTGIVLAEFYTCR